MIPLVVYESYKTFFSKKTGASYNAQQIVLFPVERRFTSQLLTSIQSILNSVNYGEDSFINFENQRMSIYDFETSLVLKKKNSGINDYPSAFESAVDRLAALTAKWQNQKTTALTPAGRIEYEARLARVGGTNPQQIVGYVLQTLQMNLGDDDIISAIKKRLMPERGQHPLSYTDITNIYLRIGGDPRILPAVFPSISAADVASAFATVSAGVGGEIYANSRLLFAAFRLLGLDSTLAANAGQQITRKKLPLILEESLIAGLGKTGRSLVLGVNKPLKPDDKTGPALILSDAAYANASADVQREYSNAHNNFNHGFIQKGTMSLQSLIRLSEDKMDRHVGGTFDNIQGAINIISYATTIFVSKSATQVDCLKKTLDFQKKLVKKNEKLLKSGRMVMSPQMQYQQQMQSPMQYQQQPVYQQPVEFPQVYQEQPVQFVENPLLNTRPSSRPVSPARSRTTSPRSTSPVNFGGLNSPGVQGNQDTEFE